ncbi:lipopolysaccharide-induced tumor necrosis factor-alpha factor homolog [Thunnus albacares]|uniref:lipopolysaccharide-induced tumor necrosis factor-alpha factor homolog n=1 Tax=Thunnus albacares TaxID=8236 RepID=UPI001CF69D22|nr:lipopolysaccharide-induced tumor necrosis factor-alpha factor homolog [Thunnus albacares]
MDPPTYEEAGLYPSAFGIEEFNTPPPPSYDASFSSPSTPPPTYGEAVTVLPDRFPILTPPTVPTAVTSPGIITHPTTHIGVTPPVVASQPQSTTSTSLSHLRDVPAEVRCPHCQNNVTTKVTYQPGRAAWCTCILLTSIGLICGFCLIPLMARGLQDAHHSCPQCGKHLHKHTR